MTKSITFYPVGNGQSALLTLDDESHILLDLLQIPEEQNDDDNRTNVHAELLKVLPRTSEGVYHVSVACFSHDDQDHCDGFELVFRHGAPSDRPGDEIRIDELWIPVRVLTEDGNDCSESARALREEAWRRLDLATDPATEDESNADGNRIVVFGNTINEEVARLPDAKRFTAGQTITTICGVERDDFEMFVHSPFRKDSDDDGVSANDVCIVGQIVVTDGRAQMRLLLGGDCGCAAWKQVWHRTAQHGREHRLDSDVFVSPHHGSYGFFTEKQGDDGRVEARDDPAQESMSVLGRVQTGGRIVCSSRPVSDANYDDNQPPHTEATRHYEKRATDVGGRFVCTMEEGSKDQPLPYTIMLTPGGIQERDASQRALSTGSAVAGTSRWGGRRA